MMKRMRIQPDADIFAELIACAGDSHVPNKIPGLPPPYLPRLLYPPSHTSRAFPANAGQLPSATQHHRF